ncbi:Hypothetical predicted protein [Mytilus galloprovincialis]|uniref:Methyltransferase type 11 domain-containing protein n=2 Tax=Mytilus galloprovincialis TaxID=29158 RepID=A0A8B6DIL8_MYTGA|nr:Hypothetical predicted protein [Mytilus galloprovincialis]
MLIKLCGQLLSRTKQYTNTTIITRNMSIRLFESSDHAKYYAQFRPDYPDTVVKSIVDYCKLSNNDFGTAIDIGCGTGQSTYSLKTYFKNVIGVDVSEKQIEQAKLKYHDIKFTVGPAEDLSFLESGSVNLITTAQALHWMNHEAFYEEVDRVLRPGGVLAVYGYGIPVENKKEAHNLVSHFYSQTLSEYWSKERKFIEQHYQSFHLPYDGWIRNDGLEIVKNWSVDQYTGYITSWSAWQKYLKSYPESKDLQTLHEQLLSLYPNDEIMTIRWPIFMLLGTKPKA